MISTAVNVKVLITIRQGQKQRILFPDAKQFVPDKNQTPCIPEASPIVVNQPFVSCAIKSLYPNLENVEKLEMYANVNPAFENEKQFAESMIESAVFDLGP